MIRLLGVALVAIALATFAVVGCGDSVSNDEALDEPFRFFYSIDNVKQQAQFFAGTMPAPGTGPNVIGIDVGRSKGVAGTIAGGNYGVRMQDTAYATAIRVIGRDSGYWIARVGQQDLLNGAQVSALVSFDIAPDLAPGNYTMEVSGVDANANFGPRQTTTFQVTARTSANASAVISLKWDALVDLDLQVVAPDGTMASPKRGSTAPPGADAGPDSGFGFLSGDSIGACVEDGFREEDLIFNSAPNPGTYKVYVNPFSMCGSPGTNYTVTVSRAGIDDAKYFGSVSAQEVQQGGYQVGDYITDVTF